MLFSIARTKKSANRKLSATKNQKEFKREKGRENPSLRVYLFLLKR
jgi:hypothetical protein